jgi:hypothetical protein
MQLTIRAADDSGPAVLTSLYRWLREDRLMAGTPGLRTHPGGALEGGRPHDAVVATITAPVTDAAVLGGVLLSVAGWRTSRPERPRVRVDYNDVVVTIEDGAPAAVRQMVDQLFAASTARPRVT